MKSHTFACGCEVTIYGDSADWEPCYIHDVTEDWNDAHSRLACSVACNHRWGATESLSRLSKGE